MDFAAVLERVGGFLEQRGTQFAVVGGVALAAYGIARTTLDLDLIVDAAAQDEVIAFMEASGYETLHRSPGYSNHAHPEPDWGRVDFVYVRGETSRRVFAEVRWITGPRGRRIPVPRPEHLAAMKIQAMHDDPSRAFQEMADLRALLARTDVDREAIREAFASRGMAERYDEILRSL